MPKGNPKRRKRRRARKKRGRAVMQLSRRTMAATMSKTTKAAIGTAVGVAGAVGTAAVVKMLPIVSPQSQALIQALMGLGLIVLMPKTARNMRIAGVGASLAGGLALVKASGLPLPLLAGYDKTVMLGKYGYRPRSMGRIMERPYPNVATAPAPGGMGLNIHYGEMRGNGRYGPKFLTPASIN